MDDTLSFSCQCGTLTGEITPAGPRHGNHAVCYCADCQAFARHLGQAERVLNSDGGTTVYQVTPEQVRFTKGADQLACLQLKKGGIYRWYTACCNTPLFNTVGNPKLAFASLVGANLYSRDLGPLRAVVGTDGTDADIAAFGRGAMMRRVMASAFWQRITGRWKNTPFFDVATLRAVVKPRVLTEEERAAAYRR